MNDLFTLDLSTLLMVALGVYILYWLRRREDRGPRRGEIPSPVSLMVVFNDKADRWEVQNDSGQLAGRVGVVQGQTIEWTVVDNTARFDFPTVLFCSVETVTTAETLALTVDADAPPGRYIYAVEIDGQCAVGGTPPEVMVEEFD